MSIIIYFFTALGGYIAFGDSVDADLLQSFPINTYSSVARIGITLNLCSSIPLQMYPAKNSVCNIFFGLEAYECSYITALRYSIPAASRLLGCWTVCQ